MPNICPKAPRLGTASPYSIRTSSPAERPKISPSYMHSAAAGGVGYTPGITARKRNSSCRLPALKKSQWKRASSSMIKRMGGDR